MRKRYLHIIVLLAGAFIFSDYAFSQPSVYTVEKLPINSGAFNEIAPTIVKDGIIYCSDRKTSSFTEGKTYNEERLYNIYLVSRKDSARWNNPERIKASGSDFLYYGPLSIAPDGKTVYFTSSIISGKAARKKINNPRGIFIGELRGTQISNVVPFEYNNQQYSVAHPSVSRDGKYLFFASDMPGGQGGSDLYYCENINGKWSAPVNMGTRINSSSRENYPYMHTSGRLYFSSDRPANAPFMGRFDIYYTALMYGEWDSPLPLPEPINSTDDDFAFSAEENLQTGYFSRGSANNDDIWKFRSTIIRKAKCDSLKKNSYCWEFYDANAVKHDTTKSPFKFTWYFSDGGTADGMRTEHCFRGPGKYSVRLEVQNLLTKELEPNQESYELEIVDAEQPYISAPQKVEPGQMIAMNADSTNLPGWNIVQYYWNFGDETIGIGKDVSKNYLRPGIYNIQLIVTDAPDADGEVREACVSKNIIVIRKQ
jgi:hypothetical protein